jgi:hypothetical protein
MNANSNHAFYLYGFTRLDLASQGAAALDEIGIDGQQPAFLWSAAGSSAVLSTVPREEFCGPAAEANLRDLAWVGPRVLRHQAVLEQAMRLAPILPARFGTLFSSLSVLGEFMERQRETILRFLQRVSDQTEWALKGLLDRARAEEEVCRQQRTGATGVPVSSPGLAYLRDQQLRLKARWELEDQLAGACGAILDELVALASEACSRPLLSRETTGVDQEMVLNWAFLVPRHAAADFQQRVGQANAGQALTGLTFRVSGPWPPYSFCPALEAPPAAAFTEESAAWNTPRE